MTDVNFPQDFYCDDVGVWRLKKEKLAELEKPKPTTNEEYIKSLNTEQFAEWIAKIVDCDCCPVKRKFCDDNPCKIRFVEWLKQTYSPK